jgi:hypothetical protein
MIVLYDGFTRLRARNVTVTALHDNAPDPRYFYKVDFYDIGNLHKDSFTISIYDADAYIQINNTKYTYCDLEHDLSNIQVELEKENILHAIENLP